MNQHNSPGGTTTVATIRPKCREASVTIVRLGPRAAGVNRGPAADPVRSAAEAGRRAARIVRRVAVEHRMCRLVTLTYRGAGVHDRRRAVADVQQFVKRLRRRCPRVRYLWVLELHPGGHGWHVHMLTDRYISKSLLADTWGLGFVDARMIRGSGPTAAKNAGRYAAKYVAKDALTAQGREPRAQRYGRSEGLGITELKEYFGTPAFARAQVELELGRKLDWYECSAAKDWTGPPCWVTSW
jgi:hypothetical protein